VISDQEYNAALELETWCDQKISEGVNSEGDFSLQDKLMYYSLVINHENFALSSLDWRERELIRIERLRELIKLRAESIINKYCK